MGYDNTTGSEPVTIKYTKSHTQGYSTAATTALEANWSITESESSEASAGIGANTIKEQISLSAKYGGSVTQTDSSTWQVSNTTTEEIDVIVPAGQYVQVWQVQVSNGDLNNVLYGDYVQTNNGEEPSTPASSYFVH